MTVQELKTQLANLDDDAEVIITNRNGDWSPIVQGDFDSDENRIELLIDED